MRVAAGDPELGLWTHIAQSDELDAAIRVKIDQVAVAGARGNPREDSDAAIVVVADAIEFLFEHRIDAGILRQRCRHAGADRTRQRQALRREALIVESSEMMPAADLELAVEAGIALLAVPDVLHLADHQRRIVDAEVDAGVVANLGILRTGSSGIAVENSRDDRQIIVDVGACPNAERGQRWRRAAARQ